MIRCEEWATLLADLAAGRLPPQRREALERHLAACPACRDLAHECRLEAHLGPAPPLLPPPAHLLEVIEQRRE